MTATHKLLVQHNEWPIGTPVELRGNQRDIKQPSGWSVLVRVADRQRKGGSWPEFVLDSKAIERNRA